MNLKVKLALGLGNFYFKNCVRSKFIPMTQVKKVVFFGLPGLGDCLMLTPAIHRFNERYPHIKIYVFAHPHTFPLFENNPYISGIIKRHNTDVENIRDLKEHNFDMAIMMEMLRTPLVAYSAGIPIRRGIFRNENGFALTHPCEYKDGFEYNCITWCNHVAGVDDKYTQPEMFGIQDGVYETKDKYLLFPEVGTNEIAQKKAWPKTYWSQLILNLGPSNCIVIGTDKEYLYYFKQYLNETNIKTTYDIKTTFQAIKSCKLVICNDSFPLHAAACLNKPTVVIFGPTDSNFLCPYKNAKIVNVNLPCGPCFYNDNIIAKCQTQECLARVSVNSVLDKIKEFRL